MLQFMGSQRVGHDWATELNCEPLEICLHACVLSHVWLCDSMDCGIHMDLTDMEYIHVDTNPTLGYNSPFVFKTAYIFILSDK